MSQTYILSIDQGTTSSRAILFDSQENVIGIEQKEFPQYFPHSGWVEHNPLEIWESQWYVIEKLLKNSGVSKEQIKSAGITNQRETTVVWDKRTGLPVYNAIVWQDRRTASICRDLQEKGYADLFTQKTGLVLDSYFSGTKIKWILDSNPDIRKAAEDGHLLFGTVDTWIIWKLTEGKVFATDTSNASRTLLFNIQTLEWDQELCTILGIPMSMLPEVKNSSDDYGVISNTLLGFELPINGVAGDQQAALFGQKCIQSGSAKNTYGTGCFMLLNTGNKPVYSKNGLLSTVAWTIDGKTTYALEGSVFIAGAAIQWLRDGLQIIESAQETEKLASSVNNTEGVYFVPAFAGLGAPYWDMDARGLISGLSRGTTRAHLVRAALEALAYQTTDVLKAMEKDSGTAIHELKVDGGAANNNFLLQFQSDVLQIPVSRPMNTESTALGAARFAGLYVGVYSLAEHVETFRKFLPSMKKEHAEELYAGWQNAVKRAHSQF